MSSAVVLLYTSFYQKVDAEELGGLWEVMKEGFISGYALFLVSSTFVTGEGDSSWEENSCGVLRVPLKMNV